MNSEIDIRSSNGLTKTLWLAPASSVISRTESAILIAQCSVWEVSDNEIRAYPSSVIAMDIDSSLRMVSYVLGVPHFRVLPLLFRGSKPVLNADN
jgi:hypothetical protein